MSPKQIALLAPRSPGGFAAVGDENFVTTVENPAWQPAPRHRPPNALRNSPVLIMTSPSHSLRTEKLVKGVGNLRIMHDVGIGTHKITHLKLHAKMLLADKSRAIIGSINLSPAVLIGGGSWQSG